MRDKAWLTTADVQGRLGLSRPTLYRIAKIKGVRVKMESVKVESKRLLWDAAGLGEVVKQIMSPHVRARCLKALKVWT